MMEINDVTPNTTIWEKLDFLYYKTKALDIYEEGNYEWEIGTHVLAILSSECADIYSMVHSLNEKIKIYGIPVRINYNNTDMIKMWKEVQYE